MDGKMFFFPPESLLIVFVATKFKVLFASCNSTWRVNNYFSRHGKGINRRNESTLNIMVIVYNCTSLIEYFLFDSIDCR